MAKDTDSAILGYVFPYWILQNLHFVEWRVVFREVLKLFSAPPFFVDNISRGRRKWLLLVLLPVAPRGDLCSKA